MTRGKRSSRLGWVLVYGFAAQTAFAEVAPGDMIVGIEEMLFADIRVTSVSKRPEGLAHAPAAITVITQEDIRRTGHRSLAEVLRLAPGLHVARLDGNSWSVSARGFNDRFNNKMLVLIDGRSVYATDNGGVYWDQSDVPLEEIERIEVIRGPGGTLWGANAMNGVINVVTKKAEDTQGLLTHAGGGDKERGFSDFRYGGRAGDHVHYRAYGRFSARADQADAAGKKAHDSWTAARSGFRVDWDGGGTDSVTVQGDYFNNMMETTFRRVTLTAPYVGEENGNNLSAGGNLLARWERKFSSSSEMRVQTFYDRSDQRWSRLDPRRPLTEVRDTGDAEFQHSFALGGRNAFVWGTGFRLTKDRFSNNFYLRFYPDEKTTRVYNAFLQDEITLVPDRLRLTVGSKYEHNVYTGGEVQPNARLVWSPRADQAVWGTVSKAVRTPARNEATCLGLQYVKLLPPPLNVGVISLQGNDKLNAEKMIAYELGYRVQPNPKVKLDVAGFYNDYKNLIDVPTAKTPFVASDVAPAVLIIPVPFANTEGGQMYGGEVGWTWTPHAHWMLIGGYAYAQEDLPKGSRYERSYPRTITNLRSSIDVTRSLEANAAVYYYDTVFKRTFTQRIDAFTRVDLGFTYRPVSYLELTAWGQNLLDPRHPEFGMTVWDRPTQTPRSFYLAASLKF
ncbi:MAG: TonB-dependent receptor [Elusimicrobia bacterium]|nr:TonB-dependent receptor [Elusimicrobiota bacterium]